MKIRPLCLTEEPFSCTITDMPVPLRTASGRSLGEEEVLAVEAGVAFGPDTNLQSSMFRDLDVSSLFTNRLLVQSKPPTTPSQTVPGPMICTKRLPVLRQQGLPDTLCETMARLPLPKAFQPVRQVRRQSTVRWLPSNRSEMCKFDCTSRH